MNDATITVSPFEKWAHINSNAEACLAISGHRCPLSSWQLGPQSLALELSGKAIFVAGTPRQRGWTSGPLDPVLPLIGGKIAKYLILQYMF